MSVQPPVMPSKLFADYPRPTMDDIRACFAYAQMLVEARLRLKETAELTAP